MKWVKKIAEVTHNISQLKPISRANGFGYGESERVREEFMGPSTPPMKIA